MSEQMKTILDVISSPMVVKNPRQDSIVLFADPKQTGDAEIDLIDQCQILVALGVLDFIDADGVDLAERTAVAATPLP
jgi:hypothetical protein